MFIWTSLVVRWIRIRLPTQRTQVLSLVWEDSMCHRAAKPLSHDYGAHGPQIRSPRTSISRVHTPRVCASQQERPPGGQPWASPQRAAPIHCNQGSPVRGREDPAQPKSKTVSEICSLDTETHHVGWWDSLHRGSHAVWDSRRAYVRANFKLMSCVY